jgi:DNA polymerase (family 10)
VQVAIHNSQISDLLNHLADLLEIEEANPFRVRAYRNAARTINDLPHEVHSMLAAGADLSELPGIGEDLAGKIREIVETGHLPLLDSVEKRTPKALAELVALPGLGPKRVKALHQALAIDTLEDLARAARAGKIRALPGFGAATEQKILQEIQRRAERQKRPMLAAAERLAEPLLDYLKAAKGVRRAIIAGSYRRRRETVGDIDILVTCARGSPVIDHFVAYEDVDDVLAKGDTRSTVVLRGGLQVDLRVVPDVSYGAALHYFTGSKAHNIAVRTMAVRKGLKLNEYGIFRGDTRIAGRSEEEIFAQVGLPYIPPELRENRGEIEAALKGKLPELVTVQDIRGDLHVHSSASDGQNTIREMAETAAKRGYAYLAIADHTQHTRIAHGLDAKRLLAQIREIDRLNGQIAGITILKSAEVDILEDGSLDLPETVLRELDLTVCAVHSNFGLSSEKQTGRIIRAMDSRYFNILAHPTGRLINQREPYAVDLEAVMQAARDRGCFLEINGHPERLDLDDLHAKQAKELGVKLALSTDAHSIHNLDFMRFGVGQARRGWIEARDVLNTRPWKELAKLLRRR